MNSTAKAGSERTPGPFPITDAILDARAWKARAEMLQTQHDELVTALRTICELSDGAMADGDGAREIAERVLAKVTP